MQTTQNTYFFQLPTFLARLFYLLGIVSLLAFPLYADHHNEKAADPKVPAHITKMLAEIADGEAILVDVREQAEWEAGHLKLADLVPLSQLKEGYQPDLGSKQQKVYLYCRSGNRVNTAKPILNKQGFDRVIALKEGFTTLRAMGIAAEDAQSPTN